MRWQAGDILSFTRGQLVSGKPETIFTGVSTDSRHTTRGELFIALMGPTYDAHDFILEVHERGAAGAVVMKEIQPIPMAVIQVDDTLEALGDIAAHTRASFAPVVVGITGTTGKTTVKEICASILSLQGNCLKTEKNYNNLIGVPLSLLKMNATHEFAVIEMGSNSPGEINRLSSIAQPTVSILTNLHPAHLNGFGDISGVIREKQAIFNNTKPNGIAVINPYLDNMNKITISKDIRQITYSDTLKADISLTEIIHQGLDGTDLIIDLAGNSIRTRVNLPGRHNVLNVLAACACATGLEIDPEIIAEGIKNARFPGMRSEIIVSDHITILNDSYNASPASMKAALEMLNYAPHACKVAVIGDMLELGQESKYWHEQLGKWISEAQIDTLVITGQMAEVVYDSAVSGGMDANSIYQAQSIDDIHTILSEMLDKDAVVLIKASRALNLDRVASFLKAVA